MNIRTFMLFTALITTEDIDSINTTGWLYSRWDIPFGVNKLHVSNQSHTTPLNINLFMAVWAGSNCEQSSRLL